MENNENEKHEKSEFEIEVENFSLDGFQIIRREFFSHIFEPAVSIQHNNVKFNMASLKKFLGVEWVQPMLNIPKNQFIVRPSNEDDIDALKWSNLKKDGSVASKTIGSAFFSTKFFQDMNWNFNCKYRVAGKLVKTPTENYLVYDLTRISIFDLTEKDIKGRRKPYLPESMLASYGESAETHNNRIFVDFKDKALKIIQISKQNKKTEGGEQLTMENLTDGK